MEDNTRYSEMDGSVQYELDNASQEWLQLEKVNLYGGWVS